jgi:hypothetical protein
VRRATACLDPGWLVQLKTRHLDRLGDELDRLREQNRQLRAELLRVREDLALEREWRAYALRQLAELRQIIEARQVAELRQRMPTTKPPAMLKPVVVTASILERPTCVSCIAFLAGCTEGDVTATLAALQPIVTSKPQVGTCWRCGGAVTLFSLQHPN